MPRGLDFDEWIGEVAVIIRAAVSWLKPNQNDEIWTQLYQAGDTPIQAAFKVASSLLSPEQWRAAEVAAAKFSADQQPDYLAITRAVAGG